MKIFFQIESAHEGVYSNPYIHSFICLAEGFKSIGVEIYGSHDYYIDVSTHSYLIAKNKDVHYSDCDVVFFSSFFFHKDDEYEKVVKEMDKKGRNYSLVLIDDADGVRTPGFRKYFRNFDMILKSHYNAKSKYPSNFVPWQFGLSNRILNALHPMAYEDRKREILVNFRAKHQLRDAVNQKILPILENYFKVNSTIDAFTPENLSGNDLLEWRQTRQRHYPDYYKRLSETMACACYGGVFAISIGNYNKYTAKIVRMFNQIIPIYHYDRVRQFDSWRLWEAWAAGCLVIHIDLERYGCKFSMDPVNGKHYIGVDMDNISEFEKMIGQEDNRLREIAQSGQAWALENFSPKAIAGRFLHLL